MTYRFNRILPVSILLFSMVFALSVVVISSSERDVALTIVDMMNAFLVIISCIFVLAIVSTLRNKEWVYKVRSAQFLGTSKTVGVWTLIGSAVVLYAVNTLLYTSGLLRSIFLYKLFMTLFGAIFAIAIFMQYMILRRYIKDLP